MLEVRLRRMDEKDLKGVLRIERQSFPIPWTYGTFLFEMLSGHGGSLVAEAEDEGTKKVLGYVCFWRMGKELHITNIAVDPRYRRRLIGERMLRQVIDTAREEGMKAITLEVRVSNMAAQRMYKKLGFVAKGLQEGYYSDNGEDAIEMSVEISEGSL